MTLAAKHTGFLLTDASFEDDLTGGVGGVLCDANGVVKHWYQLKLSANDVGYFMRKGQEVAIAELETLATVIALYLWGPILQQHVVVCLDNDVSRFGLIKGYSKAVGVTALVRIAAERCEELMVLPWFLRVP